MGTVWVFKPTPAYKFSQLCISRMVERFGQDDHNWEHIELKFKVGSIIIVLFIFTEHPWLVSFLL